MIITKKRNTKKIIIITSLLIVVCIISLGLYVYSSRNNNVDQSPTNIEDQVNKVNYDPPTEVEKNSGDVKKETIVNESSEKKKPSTAKVAITDASQYENEIEVRAFVSNVVKDGTCKIVFSQNTSSFTKEVPAYADASTTPCITLTLPRSQFSNSGTWVVEVIYSNDSVTGNASTKMEIQ